MKPRPRFDLRGLRKPKPFLSSEEDLFPSLTDRACKSCRELKDSLRSLSALHRKEMQNLTLLMGYKDLALKKRDEMLYEYNQENLGLRARVRSLEALLGRGNGGGRQGGACDPEENDVVEQSNGGSAKRGPEREKGVTNARVFSQSSFSQLSFTRNAIPSLPTHKFIATL